MENQQNVETPIKRAPNSRLEELDNRFNYHAPKDEATKIKHESIRRECLRLALFINLTVPEGREKSLAFTKLEEVMMWANAGIARNDI